jgi:hypothetical protein
MAGGTTSTRAKGWLLIAVALAVAPAEVAAQPAQSDAAATERVRFKAAQQLFDNGDFAGALPLFREVASIAGSPNAHLYIGRCLKELGKLAEAYDELTIAVRKADERAATEARYEQTRDAAAAERAALISKVALLVLAIEDRPDGLKVSISGQAIDAERFGKPMAVMPGTVTIEASATGRAAFKKEISLRAGASEAVAIALPLASPSSTAPPPPPPPETGGAVRKVGFAVAGLGAVGFVTFGITAKLADDKYKEIFAACGGTRCTDPSYSSEISSGRALDTAATLGLIAGIAGVTAGAAMIVFGGPRSGAVSAGASAQGGWMSYRQSF